MEGNIRGGRGSWLGCDDEGEGPGFPWPAEEEMARGWEVRRGLGRRSGLWLGERENKGG